MNKKIISKSLILIGVVSLIPVSYAQKPTIIYGKTSTARTDTVTVTNVQPPSDSTTNTDTSTTVTNTNTNPVNGTNTIPANGTNTIPANGTNTSTIVGVQGTSTTPTNTGTIQVGGVNQVPSNSNVGGGKGGGGKGGGKGGGHHRRKPIKLPNTATQTTVDATGPVVTGNQTSLNNSVIANGTPTNTSAVTATNTNTDSNSAVNTSSSSTSSVTSTEGNNKTKKSCEDEALKEIYKIMSSDHNNAFAKMFELTVMKLARKTLAEGNVTLEGYTQNKISEIEKQMNAVKSDVNLQNQVKAAYEVYGKASDIKTINADVDSALASGKKACYWSMNTHLWNTHVSSYVLAMSISDKNSGLTDADASIIWAVEKIRSGAGPNYKNGTENGNLLNVSNRLAMYLGTIQGGKSMSKEDLDKAIADQEQDLEEITAKAYQQVKTSLFACIDQENPSCAQCAIDQKSKFETDYLGLASIQRGLAGAVAKADNAKFEKPLRGKMGDINFDFSKTLARGAVVEGPDHMNKFDACGNPKQSDRTSTSSTPSTSSSSTSGISYPKVYTDQYIAVRDKTYVAPPANVRFSQGFKLGNLSEIKDSDACVKAHGCFQADKTPACGLCPTHP